MYVWLLCATIINYFGRVHNPNFLVYSCVMSSFANAVYQQCKECGHCPYQLCVLLSLLLHWTSNWQQSQWVSSNCTVVLQADGSDNQQNNVKYFNLRDLSYCKKKKLTNYVLTSQSRFCGLIHKYILYLKSHHQSYFFINECTSELS